MANASQTATIYALSDPRDPTIIRYIGKTQQDLVLRLTEHWGDRNRKAVGHCHKRAWLRKLHRENCRAIIWPIEICPRDGAGDRERHWIAFFNPLGLLTNTQPGGNGSFVGFARNRPRVWTEKQQAAWRHMMATRGPVKPSRYAIRRSIEARALLPRTARQIEQFDWMLKNRKFKPLTPEQRFRRGAASRARKGIPATGKHLAQILAIVAKRRKKVRCLETDQVFESVSAAIRSVGACRASKIAEAIRRNGVCKGYHWQYV